MNNAFLYKKSNISCDKIAVVIMLTYCYMYSISSFVFKSNILILGMFIVSLVLCLVTVMNGKGIVIDRYTFLWMIGFCIALFHNQRIAMGEYPIKMICWFIMVLCMISLRKSYNWLTLFRKLILVSTLIHLFFAWLFKFVPSLFYEFANNFSGMSRINMLSHYKSGYLIGLTTHYSTLAIYLGTGFVVMWSMFLGEKEKRKRKKIFWMLIITGITLAMIGKRGMLVFVVLEVFIYSILVKAKDLKKAVPVIFKYIILIVFIIMGLFLLAYTIAPQLLITIERFLNMDFGGNFSSGRFKMWKLAIELFKENPLVGIGWFGYRNEYSVAWTHAADQYLDTHNVYLQLLCETGIVGFSIFFIVMWGTLVKTIKNLRDCLFYKEDKLENGNTQILAISTSIQLLFLLYCFTGNPLYDPQNFIVYFFSIAAAYAINSKMKEGNVV